jgi:DNA-binding response OmpR family regulator
MSAGRILLVEDSPEAALLVSRRLRASGYEVHVAPDGERALLAAGRHPPDLVILDRGLPGLSGLEVCRRLREGSDVPIVFLSADGAPGDTVEGLRCGADDYIAKPCDPEVLLARVEARLRPRLAAPARARLVAGPLSLDLDGRLAELAGEAVPLTTREFELLSCLMRHRERVLSRDRLIELVWGHDFEGESNVVDAYVRLLRKKLEGPDRPRLIHAVRGAGYVLRVPPAP